MEKGTRRVLLKIAISEDAYEKLEELRAFWDRTTAAFDEIHDWEHEEVTLSGAVEGCIQLTHEGLEKYMLGTRKRSWLGR